MVPVQRQGDSNRRMRSIAEYDWRPTFGQGGDDVAGPSDAVGVYNQSMDVIQRNTADLCAVLFDQQEAAMQREMEAVSRDIDNPVHPSPYLFAWAGVEDTAKWIDADLTGLGLFQ